MHRSLWVAVACAVAVLAPLAPSPVAAARAAKPAAVLVSPSGATLKPGDTFQISAQAIDGRGNPLPGLTYAFSSSRASTLAVTAKGQATAGQPGVATVTVRAGRRKTKLTVTVLNPATAAGYVAANLTQVNHVLVDDTSVYWTEVTPTEVRVRKTSKTGGPIFDLAREGSRDQRGVRLAYAHLRQIDDRLYWTRQAVGFLDHWSIRSVSKQGGAATEILREDVSIEPLLASGWNISGKYLVVATRRADVIGLSASTTYAAYDTQTGTWAPLVTGRFEEERNFILAADDDFVYARGVTNDFDTVILKIDPSAPVNSAETLLALNDIDFGAKEAGVLVAGVLYYWTSRSSNEGGRLVSLPVTGGAPTTLFNGVVGDGLAADGVNLYWLRGTSAVTRLPVTGGAPTDLRTDLYGLAALGGLALDGTHLYVAKKETKRANSIIAVPK